MEALHSEMVKHMLEAADAQHFSVLFNQPHYWTEFSHWCRDSSEATRVIKRASEKIETVCVDENAHVYCVAMSVETLDQVVRALVDAYEDQMMERLFGTFH